MIWAPRGWLTRANLLIVVASVLIIAALAWVFYPGNMPSGFSKAEQAAKISSSSLSNISYNPVNAPHKLLLYGLQKTGSAGHTSLRLVSVFFALLFAGCFYYLVRSWFGKSIGLMATLIFCLSTFFIIAAKQASGEIMYFTPLAVMAAYLWFTRTDQKNLVLIVLMTVVGIALYVPGMLWVLLGALAFSWKKLVAKTEDVPAAYVACGFLILGMLILPLGIAIINDWRIIKPLALVPSQISEPLQLIKNTVWMASALILRAPHGSLFVLGGLPLLNMIMTALFIFGIYALFKAAKKKMLSLVLALVLAITAAGVNNNLSLLFLGLPAAGIMMAAGLRYLYIEWKGVFPRNPIPKSLALILMTLLVGVQLVYSLTYTMSAWPNASSTKNSYVIK